MNLIEITFLTVLLVIFSLFEGSQYLQYKKVQIQTIQNMNTEFKDFGIYYR